jgi:GT2 family glycosyltransferase
MLASIVIPAYKPYTLLENLLTSIENNTDIHLLEIIVVLNGSDRESLELLLNNFPYIKFFWNKEALGFTKAANIGISLANSPVTVLCNTDVVILNHNKNEWLYRLIKPLEEPEVGISGVGLMYSGWSEFFPFYFTAIKSDLFKEIGLLDLDFNPGYGEDLDFCLRAKRAGYKLCQVDNPTQNHETKMLISDFPLYHKGEGSFTDQTKRQEYLTKANYILTKKYGQEYK